MSLLEPRCLVCGAPLDRGALFGKDVRNSEVCSDKCYEVYMTDEDYESPEDAKDCEHKWIDARNEVIKSGEICLKCNSIRESKHKEEK
jgi:hypothetical protein